MIGNFEDIALPEGVAGSAAIDGDFGQADIDALFGTTEQAPLPKQGLKAVIESKVISHERLPMLEIVCERMVRSFSTSMRNLTSDAIDISLEDLTSARFGDFMNGVALPAMIGVFHVAQWENYGIVAVESALIYAVVDALLGGRRGSRPVRYRRSRLHYHRDEPCLAHAISGPRRPVGCLRANRCDRHAPG